MPFQPQLSIYPGLGLALRCTGMCFCWLGQPHVKKASLFFLNEKLQQPQNTSKTQENSLTNIICCMYNKGLSAEI